MIDSSDLLVGPNVAGPRHEAIRILQGHAMKLRIGGGGLWQVVCTRAEKDGRDEVKGSEEHCQLATEGNLLDRNTG
jgi:hypothetical protein